MCVFDCLFVCLFLLLKLVLDVRAFLCHVLKVSFQLRRSDLWIILE